MNTLFARHLFGLVVALGVATQALGSIQLQVGDSDYLGRVKPTTPSGLADQVAYINTLAGVTAGNSIVVSGKTYDRTPSSLAGPFDPATVTGAVDNTASASADRWFIDLGTQLYQYIYARYGGPETNGAADAFGAAVWYFPEGITGLVEVPKFLPYSNKYATSHITAYNPVETHAPEPASLLTWGGLAVTGMLVRRKLKK